MFRIMPEHKAIYGIYNSNNFVFAELRGHRYSTDWLRINDEWNMAEDIALGVLGQILDFFT